MWIESRAVSLFVLYVPTHTFWTNAIDVHFVHLFSSGSSVLSIRWTRRKIEEKNPCGQRNDAWTWRYYFWRCFLLLCNMQKQIQLTYQEGRHGTWIRRDQGRITTVCKPQKYPACPLPTWPDQATYWPPLLQTPCPQVTWKKGQMMAAGLQWCRWPENRGAVFVSPTSILQPPSEIKYLDELSDIWQLVFEKPDQGAGPVVGRVGSLSLLGFGRLGDGYLMSCRHFDEPDTTVDGYLRQERMVWVNIYTQCRGQYFTPDARTAQQ